MIDVAAAKRYCSEGPDAIENYELAVNSADEWHCHHRLEVVETSAGTCISTSEELKERNLYFKRPSSELIFLPKKEHHRLHHDSTRTNRSRSALAERRAVLLFKKTRSQKAVADMMGLDQTTVSRMLRRRGVSVGRGHGYVSSRHWVVVKGESLPLRSAVRKYAVVPYDSVLWRIRNGWSLEDAMYTPKYKKTS